MKDQIVMLLLGLLMALCHELGHEVEPHVPTEHLASLAQIDAR